MSFFWTKEISHFTYFYFKLISPFLTDINDCATNLCQNGGTCIDGVDAFTCDCATGYEGEDCGTSKSLSNTFCERQI